MCLEFGIQNILFLIFFLWIQDDIAHEAKTGKLYRANYFDKHGRTVLVMRPGSEVQNSIKVYQMSSICGVTL